MKKSKFVGRTFGSRKKWVCTECFLAANYNHSTVHNAYRYELVRVTHDGKCIKKITVSGPTMTKINKGLLDVETIASRKTGDLKRNTTYYTFIK